MTEMMEPELLIIFFVFLILMSVSTGLYYEIDAMIRFMTKTSGRSGFLVTRVQRPVVRWYYTCFIVTMVSAMVFYLFDSENAWVFVGFTALLVGFSLYSLLYQVCFVNSVGIGQVSRRMEMEFQWDEIESYRWEKNVLHLTMKNIRFFRPEIRFYDTDMVIAVNEHLAQVADIGGLMKE